MARRPPDPNVRESLLRAARAEFARQGIDRARVEDIAQRVGLSKGAFYLHFESKEAAFREVVQRFVGVLEEQAARRHEAQDRFIHEHGAVTAVDVAERTPRFHHALELDLACDVDLLETLWRNREILALLSTASGDPYCDVLAGFRQRMDALVAGDVARRQAAGHVRDDLDPGAVSDIVVGTYDALSRRMPSMREKPDLRRWATTVLTVLWEGIIPRGRPPAVATGAPSEET